jgi:hypothetical protein
VNERNFGEIHLIAKRIWSKSLQRDVARAWISNSEEFNKNDGQIILTLDQKHESQIDLAADTTLIAEFSAPAPVPTPVKVLAGIKFSFSYCQ